jgi:hypothetical protein
VRTVKVFSCSGIEMRGCVRDIRFWAGLESLGAGCGVVGSGRQGRPPYT